MQKDSLQRFIFVDTDIRGEIVRLNNSFTTIMEKHAYPDEIFSVLAETLVASVLLSATLKYEGQLTVQFQSEGPLKMLVAKCNQNFDIRGLAQFDKNDIAAGSSSSFNSASGINKTLFQSGELIITIEPDNKVKPYQSIVPLSEASIASNLENYFAQSVQIPTKIWLAVGKDSAAGMLLQLLPAKNQNGHESQNTQTRENFWEHAVKLGETISDEELLTLENRTILHRLYHEEEVMIFEPEGIRFKCGCSQTRMNNVIKMLGKEKTDELFSNKPVIDIACEYCQKVYAFDRVDVSAILG